MKKELHEIPRRELYPVDETRQLLGGISRATTYELFNSGALESVLIGGRRMATRRGIEKLVETAPRDGPRRRAPTEDRNPPAAA